ncbi:hypothetical protein SPI_07405 [Niveomyces insectorum RCEF 264]|uniref:2EXR domain-containing protein n=1 Tax=Niveomyces insectorum RCEF 264 TaxID=1081102 RepID=A0A167PTZ8_9HYPO|nr:hypothetical protein SPI_07405 [Niveomyces insectorum RCEF 264]
MPTEAAFHLFPALPAELRLAVWKYSCQSRVVEVWYDAAADCCRTTARPPALLHTNREARAEALRLYYRRAFVTRRCPDHHYIYFSSALDVLYLPRHGLMGYDDTARDFAVHVRETAEHVRALAIDHVRTDTIRPWEPYNKLMLIFSFPNVQETMLVVGGSGGFRRNSSSSSSYEEGAVLLRQRSHDSVESTVSANSATSANTGSDASTLNGTKPAVELVDPQGDRAAVMGLINNVIESFSREIQAANDSPLAAKDDADKDEDLPHRTYPHIPSLIPKAKAYQRRHRKKRRYAIGCA